MNLITVYGIPYCDAVRKTRQFFEKKQIKYNFFNFKQQIPDLDKIQKWLEVLSSNILINKRSSTWHQLDDDSKSSIINNQNVASILQKNLILIKRPVIEWSDGLITVGYNEKTFQGKAREQHGVL